MNFKINNKDVSVHKSNYHRHTKYGRNINFVIEVGASLLGARFLDGPPFEKMIVTVPKSSVITLFKATPIGSIHFFMTHPH